MRSRRNDAGVPVRRGSTIAAAEHGFRVGVVHPRLGAIAPVPAASGAAPEMVVDSHASVHVALTASAARCDGAAYMKWPVIMGVIAALGLVFIFVGLTFRELDKRTTNGRATGPDSVSSSSPA